MKVGMTPALPDLFGVQQTEELTAARKDQGSFMSILMDRFQSINESQLAAKASIADYLQGGDTTIEDMVVNLQKARTELQLAVAIQNKAVQAYQEISKLQV